MSHFESSAKILYLTRKSWITPACVESTIGLTSTMNATVVGTRIDRVRTRNATLRSNPMAMVAGGTITLWIKIVVVSIFDAGCKGMTTTVVHATQTNESASLAVALIACRARTTIRGSNGVDALDPGGQTAATVVDRTLIDVCAIMTISGVSRWTHGTPVTSGHVQTRYERTH